MSKISKLRLGQAHSELGDFATNAPIPVAHNSNAATLHELLQNLAVNMEARFGAKQSGGATINNQYAAAHEEGVISWFDKAGVGSYIKNDQDKISLEAKTHLSGSGDLIHFTAKSYYDVDAENIKQVAAIDFKYSGAETSTVEVTSAGHDLRLEAVQNGDMDIKMLASAEISGSAQLFRMDASQKIDMDSKGPVEVNAATSAWMIADAGVARFESLQSDVEIQAVAGQLNIDAASKDENIGGAEVILVGGARTETVAGPMTLAYNNTVNETVGGKYTISMPELDKTVNGLSTLTLGDITETSGVHSLAGTSFLGTYSGAAGYDLSATAGPMALASAGQMDVSSNDKMFFLSLDEAHMAGSETFLSASVSNLKFDDAYRAGKNISGTYVDGIKLAKDPQTWSDFEDTFGEVSLLEAIRTAALGGTPDAADYVFKVAVGGDKTVAEASAEKYTNGGNSQIAQAILSGIALPCTDLDADEIARSCAVFLNGQKLALAEDYTLDTSVANVVKVAIDFDLEIGDIVVIEIG